MNNNEADTKPVIVAAQDRGETLGLIEPMLVSASSRQRAALTDIAINLAEDSAGLRHSLPEGVLIALTDLVRSMNCYYSNLIEGHDTHPVDIERARNRDYSSDPNKRDLQIEAEAHIAVQEWIDAGSLKGRATTLAGICEIHRRFTELLPESLRWIEHLETGEKLEVIPGELRKHDVSIGGHVAISPGALPRFLERFDDVYSNLGKTDAILAAASAHHRLLWIHPFLDGNGRVSRLMSYAMLLETLDTRGLWSVARGLAHNVSDYKRHLAACDQERRNDLDGRGHLSEEALAGFTRFFLESCIDQIRFMRDLIQPDRLRNRIVIWAEEEIRASNLLPKAELVLEALLYRGQLPRGEVANLTGTQERQARRITKSLFDKKVLASEGPRSPLRLAFPARLAGRWMPGVYPQQVLNFQDLA
ncbi:MAG: Fic family protein [Gammaproteobacteria bacterium]